MPVSGLPDGAVGFDQWTRNRIGPGAVATGAAALVGSSFVRGAIVVGLKAFNSSGGSITVTTHIVPAGGSAGAGNIIDARAVAAGTTADIFGGAAGPCHLNPGDQIFMLASGAGVNATIQVNIER